MKKYKPHIIVLSKDNKLSYHHVTSYDMEAKLIGQVIGIYPTDEFLKNEKGIQSYHQDQMKNGKYQQKEVTK